MEQKLSAIHVYNNTLQNVNGSQYAVQRMTGIEEIFGMVYFFSFLFLS